MKRILLLIAIFFVTGCSEEKNKEDSFSERPSTSSEVAKQENDVQKINDLFSITDSVLKEYTDKAFNMYNITEVSYDENFYRELFSNLYGENYSFEQKIGGQESVYFVNSATRLIRIEQLSRKLAIFNTLHPTSMHWTAKEIIYHNQAGNIELPQIPENNPTIVQGKQLIEDFLKHNFNVESVDMTYVYCDKPAIEAFAEIYQNMESAKEDKGFNLSSDEPFVYYKVTPKIDTFNILGSSIISEDDGKNAISGTVMEFVVKNSRIEEFHIVNLYPFDTKASRQVSITQEGLFNNLKTILENRFTDEPVVIDKVELEYLPIIDTQREQYEYRPTLVLSTSANNSNNERFHFSPLYIDIETGEEVTR
ncbi:MULTISPECIES: hypothetical protein [unclassified Facklamia]|uniref:hypothetical protein n=1 Tax=Aerococcaceae TaxID=186827 RepID=UPI0013B6B47C|nr:MULTISPECIES: hypothetical protein [unclassified Facklamia]NEW63865.1 hypothetical protein [Facklamia sp. 252]NEW67336.1 hypothetical protein [Facklamia sp. 253]QQD65213.1 hypothetical protein JDW14_07930 [Aerococcaceae bacterium zg-252]